MRGSIVTGCLMVLLVPVLVACEPEYHVRNNGVDYYDANDMAVDSLPSQPYTKGGEYYINPDEATNTRDNRGMKAAGYGHNVNDDYRTPAPGVYPAGTVIYGDGTIVYPDGTTVYPGSTVVYPAGPTRTTTTTVIETTR